MIGELYIEQVLREGLYLVLLISAPPVLVSLIVGLIVSLIASGETKEDILKLYPYLEAKDIDEALAYAAWRVEKIDVPLVSKSV